MPLEIVTIPCLSDNYAFLLHSAETGETAPVIQMGVGLNTGQCSVGNMGSEHRFDYSVLGDSVNVAARLEGQTKAYGLDILLGEDTARAISGLAFLEIDLIIVKGKTKPISIFALLGDEIMAQSEDFKTLVATQAHFLKAYRKQSWEEAETHVKPCRKLAPELSLLYNIYAARISEYRTTPPPKDWDGTFVALSK